MNTRYTKKEFEKLLTEKLFNEFAIDIASATDEQIYRALALIARGMLSEKRKRFIARTYGANGKQVYYLCMEFLMGRSLKTSLLNLGLCGVADEVLRDYSMKLDNIYEQEPDAGLGNGGLGRLAACYLDGMATDDIPGTGYSILYEYGIFKQKIVDGWQQERADNWLPGGGVWLKSHPDQAVEVRFDGEIEESWDGVYHHVEHKNYSSVIAVPSDMYVAGYDSNGVSQLRLWQAKAPGFDMDSFNAGEYGSAITKSANAELISKVLYPNDNHIEGKILRLRQQYFLSAASIGDIAKNHLSQYGTLENLPDKVAIHVNDTHPTLAIPELMRILLDECGYTWEKAFDITRRTFAYTNHTVMSEALEKWNEDIFKKDAAAHLPNLRGAGPPLPRRPGAHLPRRRGQDQLHGRFGRRPGAHGQHLLLCVPFHQRRVSAAQRDHQAERVPRLFPVQPRKIHQRDQRHRLPPLASGRQSGPDGPSGGHHRPRLQKGCVRAEKAGEIQSGTKKCSALWRM